MKTVLKWIGIAVVIVAALVIIALAVLYIYEPDLRSAWVKPGIAQGEIPPGVDTSVVFENVNVIPMDSERILEGQTVVIEDHRIANIGTSAEIEIPADAYVVDGDGRFLIPGLSDMHMHTFGSENDLLVYLVNGVTTIRIVGGGPTSYPGMARPNQSRNESWPQYLGLVASYREWLLGGSWVGEGIADSWRGNLCKHA